MKQLKFVNPTFHEGENITVRRGTQWSGISGIVPINDELSAKILYTQVMTFTDLDDNDLLQEHDFFCRTWEGLHKEMKRIYDGFNAREVVTIVHFIPVLNSDSNQHVADNQKAIEPNGVQL